MTVSHFLKTLSALSSDLRDCPVTSARLRGTAQSGVGVGFHSCYTVGSYHHRRSFGFKFEVVPRIADYVAPGSILGICYISLRNSHIGCCR